MAVVALVASMISPTALSADEVSSQGAAPVIDVLGPDRVHIDWTAGAPSFAIVAYGIDSAYERLEITSTSGPRHRFDLVDLECDTTYQLRLWAFGGTSVEPAQPASFHTGPCERDPRITAQHVTTLSKHEAAVSIGVDRVSEATVIFGTSEEYGSAVRSSRIATEHRVRLTDLQCGTTYYYWVLVTTPDGSTGTPQRQLTTDPCERPDFVSARVIRNASGLFAVWQTDLATTAEISVATDNIGVSSSISARGIATEHARRLDEPPCDELTEVTITARTTSGEQRSSAPLQLVGAPCPDGSVPDRPIRLMTVGDSITEGDHLSGTYRAVLERSLQAAGLRVDMVGTRHGVAWGSPIDPNYGQHHVAKSGATTADIAPLVEHAAPLLRPDIALILLGTNDMGFERDLSSTVDDMTAIIASLRSANPEVRILLGLVIPCSQCGERNDAIEQLNERYRELAADDLGLGPIEIVDLATGFDPELHTVDGLHPNAEGEQLLGASWADAILAPAP